MMASIGYSRNKVKGFLCVRSYLHLVTISPKFVSDRVRHYSVCTWCGWVTHQTITTHWLLTISRLSKEDEWSSTTTGCDTFEKVLDSPEEKYLSAERPALEQLLAKSRIKVD